MTDDQRDNRPAPDPPGTEFGPVMRGRTSLLGRRPLSTGADTPTPGAGRAGPRRRPRILRAIGVGLVVVLGLALLATVGMLLYVSARIDRQEVAGLERSQPYTILVTGTDSREGLTREQQLELTTGSEGGDLTDTIFLLQGRGGRTAMLAFPRDLYVTRCDGSQGRINAAVRIGGPGCLVETITELSGIEISHHLEVDFLGFRDIVDAAGGVDLCLDSAITDQASGLDLPAGCQTLDGVDALGYVRVRKIDNDLERIKRQQQFVRALGAQVLSADVLRSPGRLFATATAAADAVTADSQLGPFDLARTAWALRGLTAGLDNAYTVPGSDAVIGGASVLTLDEAEATDLFTAFDDGSLLRRAAADPAPAPADIEVSVLNGGQSPGLAGRVAEQLRGLGFVVADVGNAAPTGRSEIRYPPAARAAAEVLQERAGHAADLVADPDVDRVTLVLGADAAGSSGSDT